MIDNLENNQDPRFLYSVVELCREQIKKITGHDWIHNRVGDNVIISELLNKVFPDGNFQHTILGQYDIVSEKYGNIDIKKYDNVRKTLTILDKIHDENTIKKFNNTNYFILLKNISYNNISFIIMENGAKIKRKVRSSINKRLKKEKSGKIKKYHSVKLNMSDISKISDFLTLEVDFPFKEKTFFRIKNNKHTIYYHDDEKTEKNP